MIVVGVDGCKGGWICAVWNTRQQTIETVVLKTFADVLKAYPKAKAIAIDIPIGLVECGRACDREARKALTCRKSSVFPAPDPRVVCMTDYHAANALMQDRCGVGISAQAFGIYPKVCEVDKIMTPELQERVIEVHPEVSFWAMNGREDICDSKKSGPGYNARLALLRSIITLSDQGWESIRNRVRGAQPDDVLDAIAAAWSARRYVNGSCCRFPVEEQRGARDLRAEIVY